MGHKDCGAVKAACQFVHCREKPKLTRNLNQLISHIFPAVMSSGRAEYVGNCTEHPDCTGDQLETKIKANILNSMTVLADRGEFTNPDHNPVLILGLYYKFDGQEIVYEWIILPESGAGSNA
jgi:carbonic anhydrase